MSEQKETMRALYTVLLTDGREICHGYNVSSDYEEACKFIDGMTETLSDALMKRNPPTLFLQNPSILYNVDNVIGVRVDFIGPKKLEELTKRLSRRAGFVKE